MALGKIMSKGELGQEYHWNKGQITNTTNYAGWFTQIHLCNMAKECRYFYTVYSKNWNVHHLVFLHIFKIPFSSACEVEAGKCK